ncbi:MAG: archease [Nitrospirota bacterium]
MPYRFLEEHAISDVAFEAWGDTIEEMLQSAARALTNTMTEDVDKIERKITKEFDVEAANVEMLVFNFLQELIFFKDAERLLFSKFDLDVNEKEGRWHLSVKSYGEELSPEKHDLRADVKAVSFHNYRVEKTPGRWEADVILDV